MIQRRVLPLYKEVGTTKFDFDSTAVRLLLDGQLMSQSQWRNIGRWLTNRSHADLFVYLTLSTAAHNREALSNGRIALSIYRRRESNGGRIAVES